MILKALGSFPDLYRDSNMPTLLLTYDFLVSGHTFCILRRFWAGFRVLVVQFPLT